MDDSGFLVVFNDTDFQDGSLTGWADENGQLEIPLVNMPDQEVA
ncbi:hypothetical protein [Nesterenkonia alba]|nr:hypothetical protein [Nesterenkonia alba]